MKKNSLKSTLRQVKVLYNITCILATLGGFLLIGTAGALECEVIGLRQAILRCAICGAAIWLFAKYAECLADYMEIIKRQIHKENEQIRQEKARIAQNRAQIIEFMKQNWHDYGQIDHA